MNKVVYVADSMYPHYIGGGELNDHEMCEILYNKDYSVTKKSSNEITITFLKENRDSFFIISNFLLVSKTCLSYIIKNLRYLIYEHDHKYLKSRNPAFFENYLAPKEEIANFDLYQNAQAILCQSSFHKDIITKNLGIDNVMNLSGNLWSADTLEFLRKCAAKTKDEGASIMLSDNWHKNTKDAISYCDVKNISYNLVKSAPYKQFLDLLSNRKRLVFFPQTPETLSRICVESRMMNMSVITNKNVGATYETWFSLKGDELIDIMIEKRKQIVDRIMGFING